MGGRFLLDTNIVIALLSGEQEIVTQIDDTGAYFISSTIAGEMFYGAFHSANVDENIQRINSFLANSDLLPCDEGTSRLYGEIKALLRSRGRPIPDNDIWIAATAKQHSLTLVTRDTHFDGVEGMTLARW